jgi:hypothetical protein
VGRSAGMVRSPARAVPRARSGAVAVAAPRSWLTVDQINAINLGLMLGSAAIAWVVPFELLLVSYAFLGPLHYLTEISWLHDRQYFTTGRYDALLLFALGVIMFFAAYTPLVPWKGWALLGLAFAVPFAFVTDRRLKLLLLAAAVPATLAFQLWPSGWSFMLIFLPTVIHVYVFTGIFILQGSIKSHSAWGYASLVVFLACGALLLFYRPPAGNYLTSKATLGMADHFNSVFNQLTTTFGTPFDWDNVTGFGRFLGFAYTYHYLNWFSKTGIIRWHAVSAARMAGIAVLWVASVGLYAYDYGVGLMALFTLSFAHVLLELPLDLRTIAGIAGRSASA